MDALTTSEKISLVLRLLGLRASWLIFENEPLLITVSCVAAYAISRVIRKKFISRNAHGSWKRITYDSLMRYAGGTLSIRQMRALTKPTRASFDEFVTKNSLPHLIEAIEHDAFLLWLGKKSEGKTLLYFHGECLIFALHLRVLLTSATRRWICVPHCPHASKLPPVYTRAA
jgi:hypothetical protein